MSEETKLTDDMEKALRAPLPAEAVSPHPTKSYLSSIKAIYVVERLNQVFGIGGWKMRNEVITEKEIGDQNKKKTMVVVKSVFTVPKYEIEVEQFGGNDNEDLGDAYKGACTDALTKIGSYLEIGIDVFKGKGDKKDNKTPAPRGAITGGVLRSVTPSKPFVGSPVQELVKVGKCDVCGATAVKAASGNYYCPNYKDHAAKKLKWHIKAEPTKLDKNTQDFVDSLPE